MVLASAGAMTSAKSTGVSSGTTSDRGERTVSASRRLAKTAAAGTERVRSAGR